MDHQLTHHLTKFSQKEFDIILICDSLLSPGNMGSLFRTADCFGVKCIFLVGVTSLVLTPRLKKAARSTENNTDHYCLETIEEALQHPLMKDFKPFCLEITTSSQPLEKKVFEGDRKIALIIGTEKFGISTKTLSLIPNHIHIEMYGKNSSMNVINATNVALFQITQLLKVLHNGKS